jgi:hypothetical protein
MNTAIFAILFRSRHVSGDSLPQAVAVLAPRVGEAVGVNRLFAVFGCSGRSLDTRDDGPRVRDEPDLHLGEQRTRHPSCSHAFCFSRQGQLITEFGQFAFDLKAPRPGNAVTFYLLTSQITGDTVPVLHNSNIDTAS